MAQQGVGGMSQQDALEALQVGREDKAGGGPAGGPAASSSSVSDGWAQRKQMAGDTDSWKDLYRVLVTSLRTSSKHFEALTLDTLALGWMGLSRSHEGLRDDIPGSPLGAEDRALVDDLLYYSQWAGAFDAGKSVAELAAALSIPASNVLAYQPLSQPLAPAYFIAVDTAQPFINIVVRGTSSWHDAMTDLVAHVDPLGEGYAHSGMLATATAIIQKQLPDLEQLLAQHVGYRIHCIGHSLGGGVAALIAYLLRTTPEYRQRLSAAQCKGVMATGFGTPPVMTQELAAACSPYCRTLVYNHDMVPRACVATLQQLQEELVAGKEAVFANNATLTWLRDSGALSTGQAVVQQLFSFAVAGSAARFAASSLTKNPGAQRFVQAGLTAGSSFLMSKFKQLHVQAMEGDVPGQLPAGSSGSSSSLSPQQAGGGVQEAAGSGSDSAEAQRLRQADAEAKAAALQTAQDREQYAQEDAAAAVRLVCPGQLLYLKRNGTDADAQLELLRAPAEGPRFGRILLNRSMLRDHYLTHYADALHKLMAQLPEGGGAGSIKAAVAADLASAAPPQQLGSGPAAAQVPPQSAGLCTQPAAEVPSRGDDAPLIEL